MNKTLLRFSFLILVFSVALSFDVAFATDIALTATDAETDGFNGFSELDGAYGVATFTVDDVPYAIVASDNDDGVQIINLSDPTNIIATDAETDGFNGFSELNGATNVAIFTVSNTPYAIVASYNDDGVQIINLSDPTNIIATDAETHGANGFTALDGANDVATFTVDDVPYAIVTSYDDDGVQIINLSDPTDIIATDAEFDEVNGFTALDAANDVATFTVDDVPYAIVVSENDDGVQIINLSDPTDIIATDAEFDEVNGFTALDGAAGVNTFTVNSIVYAIVTSIDDDGVQIINLSDPTNIIATDAETDEVNGFTVLDRSSNVATFTVDDVPYAIVASAEENGAQIINLSDPTDIIAGNTAIDEVNGFTALDSPYDVATFTSNNLLYAITTSRSGDGVQIISLPAHITDSIPSGGNGGCADCTKPTFGKNTFNSLIVWEGFTYNANSVNVTNYHTDFPEITVTTNMTNTATVKIYENQGVDNIKMVQFGLGMPEVGSPLNYAQTLAEISIDDALVEEIVVIDKNNLVDVISVSTARVFCSPDSQTQCLEVSLEYVYRDQPKYNIIAINARDSAGNSQLNFLNHGVLVVGESLNDPLKQNVAVPSEAFYPQRSGTVLLTLVDYKTDMWDDKYGNMWKHDNQYGPHLVDTLPVPQKITDEYSQWSGYNDRLHSEFPNLILQQQELAQQTIEKLYGIPVDDIVVIVSYDDLRSSPYNLDELFTQCTLLENEYTAQQWLAENYPYTITDKNTPLFSEYLLDDQPHISLSDEIAICDSKIQTLIN